MRGFGSAERGAAVTSLWPLLGRRNWQRRGASGSAAPLHYAGKAWRAFLPRIRARFPGWRFQVLARRFGEPV